MPWMTHANVTGVVPVTQPQFDLIYSPLGWTLTGAPSGQSASWPSFIEQPASPADGQLVAWNAALGAWVATNPVGASEIAYSENVTGTPTTAAPGTNAGVTDIPSCTITVPANTRPVYLRGQCAAQQSVVGTGGAALYVYETTSTPTLLCVISVAHLPNSIGTNSKNVALSGEFRLGPVASTRTFKMSIVVQSDAGQTPQVVASNLALAPSSFLAFAR